MNMVTHETHEQAMACLSCGLAGLVPPDHFPQEDGLWDLPCPQCGEHKVWVAPFREKAAIQAASES